MANSNAIATVTIQDQDLINPTFPVLAQRVSASVTFPSSNSVVFGGYVNVVGSGFTNLFTGLTVPFVYIRNASLSSNSVLFLQMTPVGASAFNINLFPGGIFVWANVIANTSNSFSQIAYAVTVGAPVPMEYMYAF